MIVVVVVFDDLDVVTACDVLIHMDFSSNVVGFSRVVLAVYSFIMLVYTFIIISVWLKVDLIGCVLILDTA